MASSRNPSAGTPRARLAYAGFGLGALLIMGGIWLSTESSEGQLTSHAALDSPAFDHGAGGLPLVPAGGGPGSAGEDRAREWESVHERLDGIEEVLRGLSARLDGSLSSLPGERVPQNDPEDPEDPDPTVQEAMLAEMQALRREVAALRTASEGRPSATEDLAFGERAGQPLAELRQEHSEPRWNEVQRVMDLWRADEGAARRELLFLCSEDLLRTYGSPTDTWSNDKGIHWLYGQGRDGEGNYTTELWICLKEDKVTMVGVK